jgi:hypothetical protein
MFVRPSQRLRALAILTLAFASPALAQAQSNSDASTQTQATGWTGMPFTSLADFERLIPIGMSSDDVVAKLGRPEMILPGREQDQVYQYGYRRPDGSEIRAVIIIRDNKVFIRRLYQSTQGGDTSRVE